MDCQHVVTASIQYRDYLKKTMEDRQFKDIMRTVIAKFGVNLYSDDEIEEILCSFIGNIRSLVFFSVQSLNYHLE